MIKGLFHGTKTSNNTRNYSSFFSYYYWPISSVRYFTTDDCWRQYASTLISHLFDDIKYGALCDTVSATGKSKA